MPDEPMIEITIEEAVWGIHAILRGRSPQMQGAILADLCAIWLAGHVVVGDAAATGALRNEVLEVHVEAIRRLIPVNAKIMGTGP